MKSTTVRRPNPRDKLKQLKERRVSSAISQQTVQTSMIIKNNTAGNSKLKIQESPRKVKIRGARDGKETRSPLQNVDFNSPTKGQIKVGSSSRASQVNEIMFVHRKRKTPIESKNDGNRSKSLLNPHHMDMSEAIPSRSEFTQVDRSKVDRLNKAISYQQKPHSNMDESTLNRNTEHNEKEKEKEENSKENEEFEVFLQELTDATHFGMVWEHFQILLGSTPQICEMDANVPYSEKTAGMLNVICRNGANRASSIQIMDIEETNLFLVDEDATKNQKRKSFEKPLLSEKTDALGKEIRYVNEDVENTSKDAFLKTEKKISVCKELPVSDSMQKEAEEEASNGSADTKPGFDPSNEPFEDQHERGESSYVSTKVTQSNCSNIDMQSSGKVVQEESTCHLDECTSYLPKSNEGTPEWLRLLKQNKKSKSTFSMQNSLEVLPNNGTKDVGFQHIQLKKVPKPNENWKSPIATSTTGCIYKGVLRSDRQEGGEDVKESLSKPLLEVLPNNGTKDVGFQHIQLKKVPKPNENWKSPIATSTTGCIYKGVLRSDRQEGGEDVKDNISKQVPWSSFTLRPVTSVDFLLSTEKAGEQTCTMRDIGNLNRSGIETGDLVSSISQECVSDNSIITPSMDTEKEQEFQVHGESAASSTSTSIMSPQSEENKSLDDSPELEYKRHGRAENHSENMKKIPNEVVSDSPVHNGDSYLTQIGGNKIDKEDDGNDDVPTPKLDEEELKLIAKYREMKRRGVSDKTIEYDLVRKGVSDSVKIHLQNEVKTNLSTPSEKNQTFNSNDCHEKPFNPFAGGGIAAAAAMAAQKKLKMAEETSNNINTNNDQTENVVPFDPFAGGGIAAAAAMAAQKKLKMAEETSNNINTNNDQTENVVPITPPFNPFTGGGIAAAAAMAAQKRTADTNSMNKEENTKSSRPPFNPFAGGGIAAAAALAAQKKINQGDDTQNSLSSRTNEEKIVVALKDDPKFKKYFMMKKVGLDNEQIKHAMEKDGLDPTIFDGDHNKPYIPPSPAVALKDDPKFKKYFMMKKVGLDNEQIKHAMEKDGLDPAIFDGDHDKPAQTQPSTRKGQIGKKSQKPLERLPQVNITPINTSKKKVRNSLWGNEDVTIGLKLDEVDMKRKFEKKRHAPQLPKVKLAVKNIEDSFSKVELIKDHTKKIKCASAYSNIKDFPTEDLIQAVNKVDSMYFKSREVVEHINTCLPEDMEIAELREWKLLLANSEKSEDFLMSKLKDFEKFLIRISSVKRYREKIHALLFMLEFPSKVRNVRNNLLLIENACNEIKGSEKLRQILRFTLGCINTLNRNKVEAIVVSSLGELKNTKDGDKTMSVLEYIVNIILDQDEDLLTFIDEIPSLDLVCKFTWKDSVDQEKNDIENKVRKVRLLEDECITVRGFLEEQKLHSKGTFLADLRDEICTTKDRFKKLRTDYFAEDENEISDLDWFVAFITFAKDLNDAKTKIKNQRERERMRERRINTKNRPHVQAHGFERNGLASTELTLLLHKQRQRSE